MALAIAVTLSNALHSSPCWQLSTTFDRNIAAASNVRPVVVRAGASGKQSSNTRIAEKCADLKKQGKAAFIPYITAGDPDMETSALALQVLDASGADIIELGVPCSDPIADGPVIRASATRSLRNGASMKKVLTLLREVVPKLEAPVVLFTYYNPILHYGLKDFVKAVKDAGGSGLIVPDLPLEKTGELQELSIDFGLELILMTTPTTPKDRICVIANASQGFVYLVSRTGVTGARSSVQIGVKDLLEEVKQVTDKPIAVGFGISTPEQAAQIVQWGADGVIVGSAMVKALGQAETAKEGLVALEKLTHSIKSSILNPGSISDASLRQHAFNV